MVLEADESKKENGEAILVVAYGMGVHWALNASKDYKGRVGILDLRTLYPLDTEMIYKEARQYHRILVVTEEPSENGFGQSIAARVQANCFESLDAPVKVIGAANMPAIPLNEVLEKAMIPSAEKVSVAIGELLEY